MTFYNSRLLGVSLSVLCFIAAPAVAMDARTNCLALPHANGMLKVLVSNDVQSSAAASCLLESQLTGSEHLEIVESASYDQNNVGVALEYMALNGVVFYDPVETSDRSLLLLGTSFGVGDTVPSRATVGSRFEELAHVAHGKDGPLKRGVAAYVRLIENYKPMASYEYSSSDEKMQHFFVYRLACE